MVIVSSTADLVGFFSHKLTALSLLFLFSDQDVDVECSITITILYLYLCRRFEGENSQPKPGITQMMVI